MISNTFCSFLFQCFQNIFEIKTIIFVIKKNFYHFYLNNIYLNNNNNNIAIF